MYNGTSRHIDNSQNIITQLLATRTMFINYMKSKDNLVYLLSKKLN